MKKAIRKILLVTTMITLMLSCIVTAQAKAKKTTKLKVNTVYDYVRYTQTISGRTKKGATVTVKAGKKKNGKYKYKQTIKANKKTGKFTVYMPIKDAVDSKAYAAGAKIKVSVKKGKWKKNKTVKIKNWWKQKIYKKHKAVIAGDTSLDYGRKFSQIATKFVLHCKKGYYAEYKISGKTIKLDAAKKARIYYIGNYEKLSAVGARGVKIKVYNAKTKRLVESYTQRPKIITIPKKTDPIDYDKVMKDYKKVMKTGKEIDKSIEKQNCPGEYLYVYTIWPNNSMTIGCAWEWMKLEASGSHVILKAKNGATLYYTIGFKGNFNFEPPTLTKYDGVLKSGQKKNGRVVIFKRENFRTIIFI